MRGSVNLSAAAKQVLTTIAPMLATAVGGPFAGMATSVLLQKLGIDPKTPDPEAAVNAALSNASQDTLLKLKAAEMDLTAKLAELGVQREQLELADVANARNLAIQTKTWTPTILSYSMLGGTLAAALAVIVGGVHIPQDQGTALTFGTIFGYLFSENKAILAYWFGSSRGSQDKDATIASLAKDS